MAGCLGFCPGDEYEGFAPFDDPSLFERAPRDAPPGVIAGPHNNDPDTDKLSYGFERSSYSDEDFYDELVDAGASVSMTIREGGRGTVNMIEYSGAKPSKALMRDLAEFAFAKLDLGPVPDNLHISVLCADQGP